VPERRRIHELVVIESSDLNEEQRFAMARGLRTAWSEGADPAKLAEERPDNVRYLELDFLTKDDLTTGLREAVFDAEIGEISAPLNARGGVHVLQVREVQEASLLDYEEVRDQLLANERRSRYDEELDKYLRELEARAFVDTNLPSELADFRTATGRLVDEGGRQYLLGGESTDELFGSGDAAESSDSD
jgi:parvulin-like peptidyl-prolyl isomerase